MKQSSTIFVFSFLGICSLLLLLLGTFSFFRPLNSVITFFTTPIQAGLYHVFQNTQTRDTKVDMLLAENAKLTKLLVDQKKLLAENQALRDQFQTNRSDNKLLIPTSVIGAPGFFPGVSPPDMLIVDGGSKDGIQKGQAVIVDDNLIGTISRVSESLSVVELFTQNAPLFTAKTLETGAVGVVKAGDTSGLSLTNVLLSQHLKRGDVVVTKGDIDEGGIGIPPDLVVGQIVDIDKKASSLFQTAQLKSLVDVSKLSTVFILPSLK